MTMTDKSSVTLGQLIRERRTAFKMTQKELAFRLGISSAAIGAAERGAFNLSTKHFQNLAEILQVPVEQIVDLHVKQNQEQVFKSSVRAFAKAASAMRDAYDWTIMPLAEEHPAYPFGPNTLNFVVTCIKVWEREINGVDSDVNDADNR